MDKKSEIYQIQLIVADYFNAPVEALQLKTRKRKIVMLRQIAMYFARKKTKSTLELIGMQIGGKDHATVLHACKTVQNLMDTEKKFKYHIAEIEKKISDTTITREEIHAAIMSGIMRLLKKTIAINKNRAC